MPDPDINGRLAKLRAYAAVLKDVGITTIIILVGLGVYTGYVSSPLALEQTLKRHDEDMAKIVVNRTARDVKLTEVLDRLATAAETQNKVNTKLLCLAWARDEAARQACLRG